MPAYRPKHTQITFLGRKHAPRTRANVERVGDAHGDLVIDGTDASRGVCRACNRASQLVRGYACARCGSTRGLVPHDAPREDRLASWASWATENGLDVAPAAHAPTTPAISTARLPRTLRRILRARSRRVEASM